MNAQTILQQIASKEILKSSAHSLFLAAGYKDICCDIDAAKGVFNIDSRYSEQVVQIPLGKKGNLAAYAGKKVSIICTTIKRNGPRIQFFIKEVDSTLCLSH